MNKKIFYPTTIFLAILGLFVFGPSALGVGASTDCDIEYPYGSSAECESSSSADCGCLSTCTDTCADKTSPQNVYWCRTSSYYCSCTNEKNCSGSLPSCSNNVVGCQESWSCSRGYSCDCNAECNSSYTCGEDDLCCEPDYDKNYGTCYCDAECYTNECESGECDCDSNSECPSGYVCHFQTGSDLCVSCDDNPYDCQNTLNCADGKICDCDAECINDCDFQYGDWGYCYSACTPNCTGKECGDDGCGGSCGSCGTNEHCSSGSCVCDTGYTDCGGTCYTGTGRCCSGTWDTTRTNPNSYVSGCRTDGCVGTSWQYVPANAGSACGSDLGPLCKDIATCDAWYYKNTCSSGYCTGGTVWSSNAADDSDCDDEVCATGKSCYAGACLPLVNTFYSTPSDTVNDGGEVTLYLKGTDASGMQKIETWYNDAWHTCYCDGRSPACSTTNSYNSTYGYYYCSNSWTFTETIDVSAKWEFYYAYVYNAGGQKSNPDYPGYADVYVVDGCANWTDCSALSISDSQYVNNMNCSITCACPEGNNIKVTSSGDTESSYDKLNICGTNYSGEWTSQVKDCGARSATLSFTSDSTSCGNSNCASGASSYGFVTINSMQCISVNCVAPGNFRCTTITERSIKIVWDAVTGATAYRAEWCEDGKTWGAADCCPTGTCNIVTSATETTVPDLMYDTTYNFRVRVNTATGCDVPGTWAETTCTTDWPNCGAGCSTKSSGTNCGYSYGAIGTSCIVGGLDNHGWLFDVGVSQCYDAGLVCRRNACPISSTPGFDNYANGASCNVVGYWESGIIIPCHTWANPGVWDKSEYKCIECSTANKENVICGDSLGTYTYDDNDYHYCTKAGDYQCESACNGDSYCDEKTAEHYYKTSEIRLDWCNADCYSDYTLCNTYTECTSDPEGFDENFYCYYSGGSYHWNTSPGPSTETECSDGHDNDCDGYTDCDSLWPDPDCPCDTTPPTSKITNISPAPSYDTTNKAWLRANDDGSNKTYTISISDSDNVGGSGLDYCIYELYDSTTGYVKNPGTSRTCNSTITFTVGPTGNCRTTNARNSCILYVSSLDKASLWSNLTTPPNNESTYSAFGTNYFPFDIDFTPPTTNVR